MYVYSNVTNTTEANNLVKYTSWPWANFELLAQELEVACFRPCSKTSKKKTIHACTALKTDIDIGSLYGIV